MNDTNKQILELLKQNGKSAPEMTHALKFLGGGSMEKGLARISDYFAREIKNGTTKGVVSGAAGATLLIAIITLVRKKIDENKMHKEEGKAIIKGLETGLNDHLEEAEYVLSDTKEAKCME